MGSKDSELHISHVVPDGGALQDVLVVTQSQQNRATLSSILKRIDYNYIEVTDFGSAMSMLSEQHFSGVICDSRLGDDATALFLANLRDLPRYHTLPVVVIVADENELTFDPLLAGADTVCEEEQLQKNLPRQLAILLDW